MTENTTMLNGAELVKKSTETVERLIFLGYLRDIQNGEEDIDDVIRHYEELVPDHGSITKS